MNHHFIDSIDEMYRCIRLHNTEWMMFQYSDHRGKGFV